MYFVTIFLDYHIPITRAEPEVSLMDVNWCHEEGYRILINEKRSVRQAEAKDIKNVLRDMNDKGRPFLCLENELCQTSWSSPCMTAKNQYQFLWTKKLQFIREKNWLNNEQNVLLLSKRYYHENIEESKTILQKTDISEVSMFFWQLQIQNQKATNNEEELKQMNAQIKSVYTIYDIILACKEKMMSNLSNLSNNDARRYYDFSVIASIFIERRLPRFDFNKTIDKTLMIEEYTIAIYKLHWIHWRYKSILIILQTVLTLQCLAKEDKRMFMESLEIYKDQTDINEACYIYTFMHAYLKGKNVNYDEKHVDTIREEFEQMLIQIDAFLTKHLLLAITALHFDSGKNQNQKGIESKEVHIVMNWLCNSWLGHENVIMTDNLDESTLQQINKSELESAERMFSTVRWVDIYFEEVLFLRSFSTPIKKARRILGRMYFDTQPLQGNQETVNFHDSEEEEALKEKQFQL
ncbi:unnamed protein product, partial [Rotaria sordida]